MEQARDWEREGRELDAALAAKGIAGEGTLLQCVNAYLSIFTNDERVVLRVPDALATAQEAEHKLSEDQQKAWDKIVAWAVGKEPNFVLRGFAGTGKSFLMRKLPELKQEVFYTATTNKAAKVLGKSVGKMAKTTYSLLGLRMQEEDDKLVLTPAKDPPYLPRGSIVVVDEASMVGSVLLQAIDEARKRCGIRVMYVGDPAQLPPVGEPRSPAWDITKDPKCAALLKQVMRHDNQLLELATELRRCIKEQDWESPLGSNHDDEQGVWFWGSSEKFERQALARFKPKEREVKIIAWRNKTVERYNMIVRSHLGFRHPFCVDDVLLLAEPIERDGHLIAHTDDEFLVTGVDEDCVNTGLERVDTWRLAVDGDQTLVLQVPRDEGQLQAILSVLAGEARQAKGKHAAIAWKKFWTVKRMFQRVRYGYALTAHRAQGSTYDTVFVDQLDILANQAKKEAFKCLYVATTRASRAVHSF